MKWTERIAAELEDAGRRSMRRSLRVLESVHDASACVNGRAVLNLCHNDYLGLGREPEVLEGACDAIFDWGAGSAASRLITGTSRLVGELEETLAELKGASSALVFPTGYQASLGVVSALVGEGDAVFVDRLAHACLVDGVRLSGARLRVFPHNDVTRLEHLLAAHRDAPGRWILVDGVYSMDGDLAPLPDLIRVARATDSVIVMDDAHGTGMVGEKGRGTAEHFGIDPREHEDCLVILATLSKALGSQGGVALSSELVREALINRARTFIYSTGLAPGCIGAALAAARILMREPGRAAALQDRSRRVRERLRGAGLDTMASETAIIPIARGGAEEAVAASQRLLDQDVLVLAIRPPTVPRGTSRLRLAANMLLTEEELDRALDAVIRSCAPE